jgi:hypothetical protein
MQTGKTLTARVLEANVRGATSPKTALRALKALYLYTYQCSAASTAEQIDRVYASAVERAAQLAQRGRTSERQLVFIDEATLPPAAVAALKVLHYYLDKPKVGTLMLANKLLDTAKTGRMIQVCPCVFGCSKECVRIKGSYWSRRSECGGRRRDNSGLSALCRTPTHLLHFTL